MNTVAEIITWTLVAAQLPDDEQAVMINTVEWHEPVWIGYYEAGCWHLIDGTALADDVVIAWADLPAGIEGE
ncbi:MAG: hypothetical protein M0Q95_10955 [Porticoccaceae bacterium]|nr:hypothetical protein [Porticoccaceae bacterium]